jgi:hypothetical protein
MSCSLKKNYYEKPIENWLNENLNDISSYESVEFIVLDSSTLVENNPWLETKLSNLFSVMFRKAYLLPSATNSISDPNLKKELLNNQNTLLSQLKTVNINNIPLLLELNNSVDKNLILIRKDSIDLISMLEGTNYRIKQEKIALESELSKIGSSINSITSELKNGQFIYHKLRAKNGFGAIILSSWIFKLNENKTIVEESYKTQ